jgi:uncharacterized protein (TIGR03792 family)
MELNGIRQPLDAPQIPSIDGELIAPIGADDELTVAVIEHLRVKVPAAARQAWLEAERGSWEPWLARQSGYLGRELHWDAEREEGQLLIRWASREQWKAIPAAEVEAVQERFELLAHAALVRVGLLPPLAPEAAIEVGAGPPSDPATATSSEGTSNGPTVSLPNPFPLVFEAELSPDGQP